MFITDFICAVVEGNTADGRKVEAQQIKDMAASYSATTYVARIWLEHIRGIDPNSMFKALGDVVEVKAEPIADGELKGKLALFVRLAPHQDLIAMVRNGQKVHLSVEIDPNFAGSGKAYLVGVGVTDSPASLGTGVMKFSANERNTHLFTTPKPVEIKEPIHQGVDSGWFSVLLARQNDELKIELKNVFSKLAVLEGLVNKVVELATPPNYNYNKRDRDFCGGGYKEKSDSVPY